MSKLIPNKIYNDVCKKFNNDKNLRKKDVKISIPAYEDGKYLTITHLGDVAQWELILILESYYRSINDYTGKYGICLIKRNEEMFKDKYFGNKYLKLEGEIMSFKGIFNSSISFIHRRSSLHLKDNINNFLPYVIYKKPEHKKYKKNIYLNFNMKDINIEISEN